MTPFALALALVAAPAVEVVDCEGLSGQRVGELLVVEHPDLASARGPKIELRCDEATVQITVEDPVTSKTVRRAIGMPEGAPETREREVALAVSSLLVASWMELFVPAERVHPPLPPASTETTVAKKVVDEVVESEPAASAQVDTGVRWRALPNTLTVFHTGLRVGGFVHPSWELFGQAAYEYGRADRVRGQVEVHAALFGPGVAWTLRPDKDVGFQIWGALMGAYVSLAGRAPAKGVDPGTVHGVSGELELGFGPRFRSGGFIAVLDVRAGYTAPNPQGLVSGETPASLGGFWVGAALRLGGLFGRRPRRSAQVNACAAT